MCRSVCRIISNKVVKTGSKIAARWADAGDDRCGSKWDRAKPGKISFSSTGKVDEHLRKSLHARLILAERADRIVRFGATRRYSYARGRQEEERASTATKRERAPLAATRLFSACERKRSQLSIVRFDEPVKYTRHLFRDNSFKKRDIEFSRVTTSAGGSERKYANKTGKAQRRESEIAETRPRTAGESLALQRLTANVARRVGDRGESHNWLSRRATLSRYFASSIAVRRSALLDPRERG